MPRDPVVDLVALASRITTATAAEKARRLDDAGYGDVRPSHAAVLDGVATGDSTAAVLAPRLGVSPQAVSKTATELVNHGYLTAAADPDDGRRRVLGLTLRGQEFVAARARVRNAVAREQHRWLGTRDGAELARLLIALGERYDRSTSD